MARGADARHRVWLRAGAMWSAAGLTEHAGALYERALRFAPDEPEALAGLGAALVAEGREARGVDVLARALRRSLETGAAGAAVRLRLARALAERLVDLPAAVAHAAAIPGDAPEAAEARGLEGRWRARLGDLAGASLAYARLRELATSMPPAADGAQARAAVDHLREGAELERAQLHDPLAAQRHPATRRCACVRVTRSSCVRTREVGRLVARAAGAAVDDDGEDAQSTRAEASDLPAAFDEHEEASATHHRPSLMERPDLDLSLSSDSDVEAAAQAEELQRTLRANPADDAVADELASVLESLGRGHELLALLIARLEDATPDRRAQLVPRTRAALDRLAVEAERAGRLEEAALYRTTLEGL